jgi:hypothetical protein
VFEEITETYREDFGAGKSDTQALTNVLEDSVLGDSFSALKIESLGWVDAIDNPPLIDEEDEEDDKEDDDDDDEEDE